MLPPLLRRAALSSALLLVALPGRARAEVLRVPQQYASIQLAVDAAEAGDTVLIAKGDYVEAVVLSGRTELTLIGKGKPRLLPQAAPESVGGDLPPALTLISCTAIELRGLVVERAFDATGIQVNTSADVLLRSCAIEGQPDAGEGDGGAGLQLNSSSAIVVDRCRVSGGSGDGLAVSSCDDVAILRTRVEGSGEDGVSVSSSSDVRLERCRLLSIGEDAVTQSSGSFPSSVVLERCRIADAGESALSVSSGATDSTLRVERCRITDTGERGVQVSGARSDIVIVRTLIQRAGDDGIQALGRAVTLERVVVTDTGGDAIDIEPIAGPPTFTSAGVAVEGPVLVSDCRILRAGDDGLFLEASGALVEGLKLKGAGDDGLRLGDASAMTLRSIKLSDVHRGLRLFDVHDSLFQDLRLSKLSDGVYVDFASQGNSFEAIRVSAPAGDGFDIDGPDNSFTGNVVKQAGDHGFSVESTGNLFTDNVAQKSGLVDLQDTSTPGANTYVGNQFGTTELP